MDFSEIGYYTVFGKPLIFYFGIITYLLFVLAALIAFSSKRGILKIPFVWHKRVAVVALLFGLVHGLFGILGYL